MLELSAVKKSYNKQVILDIPSLQVKDGVHWVKGANGSGKTTFLKMIAGLIPFDGDILFNGIDLKTRPLLYRQNIGWAEAEPIYPLFMSGSELLLLYQKIRKVSKREVELVIELFNMNAYVNNKVQTYSTGMIKKLSLTLALLGNQQLIILDEPLITLDPDAITSLCLYTAEKLKQHKMTFLISSHQELDRRLLYPANELLVTNHTVL